jgi:hypothetical protein
MPDDTKPVESVASHRLTKAIVALAIGLAVALYAFQFATDPRTADQRAEEEATVHAARDILHGYIAPEGSLEIVDPLAPNRAIGKVYIYPSGEGFEVSGYYRRGEGAFWHPFLMKLDAESRLVELSVRDTDAGLARRALADPKLVVSKE